ncbi:MAG: hypothetical protein K2G41_04000 [Duncaniella sp.]|uniref:hypothetical protein n=1 Tax=Duncaniella sp. TaxID=2518496 RepID=UPI0023C854C1|nr:hypothetical protein [Duncaniella sp.]MDE6089846.1 hypothetical protein [Duncaniella sp.]
MNNLKINAITDFDSTNNLVDFEVENAFTKCEISEVNKEAVESENEGLNLLDFSSVALKKHINQTVPFFGDFDEEACDIVCEISLKTESTAFDEFGNKEVCEKQISDLNDTQKAVIRENLETINKISYKGIKLVNLDVDYIIKTGKVTINDWLM